MIIVLSLPWVLVLTTAAGLGAFSVIHNLSFPKGCGVNDLITNHLTSIVYEDFEHVASLIHQAGAGTLIAKADI